MVASRPVGLPKNLLARSSSKGTGDEVARDGERRPDVEADAGAVADASAIVIKAVQRIAGGVGEDTVRDDDGTRFAGRERDRHIVRRLRRGRLLAPAAAIVIVVAGDGADGQDGHQ